MPGAIENVINFSYGFVDPYVEKTRNAVPLFDKAAHQIEERIPPLIRKVDQIADPAIEKLRPTVEPIFNAGVKKAEDVKKMATPYYEYGAKNVGKAKDMMTPFCKEAVKEVGEIREAATSDVKQICRVRAVSNLQDLKRLKTVPLIYKLVDENLTKLEAFIDKYLPPPPNDADAKSDKSGSDISTGSSQKSLSVPARVVCLPFMLANRVAYKAMSYVPKKEDLTTAKLKALGGQAAKKAATKALKVWAQAKPVLEPKYKMLSQTSIFKSLVSAAGSALKIANSSCETVLGKETTKKYVTKIETLVSEVAKAAEKEMKTLATTAPPQKSAQKPAQKKEK